MIPGTPVGDLQGVVVLIAGVDTAYLQLLQYVLETEGVAATLAGVDFDLLQAATQTAAEILLLDGTPADGPMAEMSRRLATTAATAQHRAIILVDRDAVPRPSAGGDRILYLPRASHPRQIIAGLRRLQQGERPNPRRGTLSYADVDMHLAAHRVRRAGREIHLTPIEYRLLRHFLEHPERALSREELARAVWPAETSVSDRTIDVHLGRLRPATLWRLARKSKRSCRASFSEVLASLSVSPSFVITALVHVSAPRPHDRG